MSSERSKSRQNHALLEAKTLEQELSLHFPFHDGEIHPRARVCAHWRRVHGDGSNGCPVLLRQPLRANAAANAPARTLGVTAGKRTGTCKSSHRVYRISQSIDWENHSGKITKLVALPQNLSVAIHRYRFDTQQRRYQRHALSLEQRPYR